MLNKELYKQKLEKAGSEIYEAMSSINTTEVIYRLNKTYSIKAPAENKNLAYIVGEVLLGITHPKYFISELRHNLFVSKETAILIATEINSKIFKPVKKQLIKIHKIGGKTEKSKQVKPTLSIPTKPKIPKPPTPVSL